MKKLIYFIFMVFTFVMTGCNKDENSSTYTQAELEAFLIRDCKEAIYVFNDQNLIYSFDFKKMPEGNIGEYHRHQLVGSKSKNCDFIWDVKPDNNGGIVTMSFEEAAGRIIVRMELMEQKFTSINIGQDGSTNMQNGSQKLWKLKFGIKDDPFK